MPKRALAVSFFAVLLAVAYQRGQSQSESFPEQARRMSAAAEKTGLAEPYKGITTNGTIQPGLFKIHSTGVTTEPVRAAAVALLGALSPEQRKKTMFPVDDIEWRKWMNQDFYIRQGVGFNEMSEGQRETAFALMRAGLSAKGMEMSRDIMRLNYTLGELNNNNFDRYGEFAYWITVMGEPSATKPWGWQLDGHHLIVNYFVLGDQVVMSPVFLGSEPVIAHAGKFQGTAILQDEQKMGVRMIHSLNEAQRTKAILNPNKTKNYNLTEAFKDNVVLDYAGVRASEMSAPAKDQLLALINLYVSNEDDGHARIRMDEVRQHMGDTYFAWIGGTEETSVFYYRIHSPVILIEFDHQSPAGLRHLSANPSMPDHEHIHTVMRTPNGNDYGKDLLRQHYQMYPH
jgi:hypothetical protein